MPTTGLFQRIFFATACLFCCLHVWAQPPERRPPPSPEEAQKIKVRIEEELKAATSDTAKVRLQMQLAQVTSRDNFNDALKMAQEATALAEKTGHSETIVRSYFGIATICLTANRIDNALECFNKGLPLAEKSGKADLQELFYRNLAQIYLNRGVYEKALDYYRKACMALEKMQAPPGRRAGMLIQVGSVLDRTGKHREAVEAFRQALQLAEQTEEWEKIGGIWQNMGNAYDAMGEKTQAEQAFSKAQEYLERNKKKVRSPANNSSGNN